MIIKHFFPKNLIYLRIALNFDSKNSKIFTYLDAQLNIS
jgi:hypothetical protein